MPTIHHIPRPSRERRSLDHAYDDLSYECQQAGLSRPLWLYDALDAGLGWLSRMVYRYGQWRQA